MAFDHPLASPVSKGVPRRFRVELMKLIKANILWTLSTEGRSMAERRSSRRMRLAPSAATAGGGDASLAGDAVESLQHVMDVVARAFRGLGFREVRSLRGASDFEVLRTLAARTAELHGSDLAKAHLRGLDARHALVTAAGGMLDGSDVARLLGMTPAGVHKRYQAGQLLGVREEKRRIGYPALQLDGPRVVRDLPRVLAVLAEKKTDEWSQLRFLAGSSARLGGRTPVESLKAGDVQAVLAAARAFGEHGAA
jgi:hypothetical protein